MKGCHAPALRASLSSALRFFRSTPPIPSTPHHTTLRCQSTVPIPGQMAPPSSSSWVILGSIPRVSNLPADEGRDVSVALAAPPRVSILTVSPRVFPARPTPHYFPFVLAADPSGLLLLQANQGCPATREVVDHPGHQSSCWKFSKPHYFVLDAATTSSAFRLPDPTSNILHQAMLGLLVSPSGAGHYMVAELQPIIGLDRADLLCFSTEVGEWVEKSVHYPLPPRPLAPICVVSHHGRLWWVDLSWGVIHCDPFADHPVLGFVPFPPDRVLECREGWGVTDHYRCVGVSGGKLRFVDTYMSRRAGGGPPTVSVWTLADPDSKVWTLEHEARFADIWADDSYKATGLSRKIPTLATIHPDKPAVVYFFLEEHLFGVDVRARKIVEYEIYGLVAPPSLCIASRFVRPWVLPRALSSGTGLMALPRLKVLMHGHTSHRLGTTTWLERAGRHSLDELERKQVFLANSLLPRCSTELKLWSDLKGYA